MGRSKKCKRSAAELEELRSRPIICALEAVVHGPQGSEREEVLEVGGVVGPVAKFQVVGLEDGLPVIRRQGSDGSASGDKIELVVFSADGLRVDVSAFVSSGVLEGKEIVVPLLPGDGAAKIRGAHSKVYECYFVEGRLVGIEVDGASRVPFEQPGRPKKARRGRGTAIGSGRGTSSNRCVLSRGRGPIKGGSTAKTGCV